jgi:glycosyltransferase involved in cell wall biosynthesis
MGYSENCLPKALAALGHDVYVLTSVWNVYGTQSDYQSNYLSFLGPANQGEKEFQVDGYNVIRLPSQTIAGYVNLSGLYSTLRRLEPVVVHCTEIASIPNFKLALLKPLLGYKLFTETHQHLSVVRPYLLAKRGNLLKKLAYRLTRTLPTFLASLAVEKCFAIAPDCLQVANRFFGVPLRKLHLQSLGTDTEMFSPARTPDDFAARKRLRDAMGCDANDVVCIYTGRFSQDKNPLLLSQAVEKLSGAGKRYRALFIGDGAQRDAIRQSGRSAILSFMRHRELATYYKAADIAVWPRQESMSMLDAAAACLPLVVSDQIGERGRIEGNGLYYRENSVDSLAETLAKLKDPGFRAALGQSGRSKMVAQFSWKSIATGFCDAYRSALQGSVNQRGS